jgi:hypothetical protein
MGCLMERQMTITHQFWTVAADNTGDCGPEQIYGDMDPPTFSSREAAERWIEENIDGAREVAPHVEFLVVEA